MEGVDGQGNYGSEGKYTLVPLHIVQCEYIAMVQYGSSE
jgi:hypothetical protein